MYLQKESRKKISLNFFLKIAGFFPINCRDLPCISFFLFWLKQILLPVGLLTQYCWLECCTSIERSRLNPNKPEFFQAFLSQPQSCVFNCDDLLCIYFNLNNDKNAKSLVKLQKLRGSLYTGLTYTKVSPLLIIMVPTTKKICHYTIGS